MTSVSPVSEDDELWAITRQLCGTLSLDFSIFKGMLWCDFLQEARTPQKVRVRTFRGRFIGHMLSAHFPVVFDHKVLFREMMRGKLKPDEWRPLICSSLIFFNKLRLKRYLLTVLALLPFLATLTIAVIGLLSYSLNGHALVPLEVNILLFVIFLVSPFFPGAYLLRRFDRGLVLLADRKTSVLLGNEDFLRVLQRIDAMRQSDLLSGKVDEWRDFVFVPSLSRRIANLTAMS